MNQYLLILLIIGLLVAGGIATGYIPNPFEKEESTPPSPPPEYKYTQYITNSNVRVAVIYLYHNVSYDGTIISNVTKSMTGDFTAPPLDLPSYNVESFYAKYGLNIIPSYHQYSVGPLKHEGYSGWQLCQEVAGAWLYENPLVSEQIYDGHDIMMFVIDEPNLDTTAGSTSGYVFVDADLTKSTSLLITSKGISALSFVFAHEIAHQFGGLDYTFPQNTRSVLEGGGTHTSQLTKGGNIDTIFTSSELEDDLHFGWLERTTYEGMLAWI